MRSEAVLARLFALRALLVLTGAALLLACLASGAWAAGGQAAMVASGTPGLPSAGLQGEPV